MKPLLSLVLLSTLIACGSDRAAVSFDERERIERGVHAAVEAFADAERRRDVDAILGFIASDFYMYVDGTRADYATVTEQIRATMPALERFETTWSDVEVTVLDPDHALVTLLFEDAVTDAEGVRTELRGPTTFIWRLEAGEWRILYADADHYPVDGR